MNYETALKTLKTPKEWTDYYYNKYGSFRVQVFINNPTSWLNYNPTYYTGEIHNFPNHRERFVDELVIDVDGVRPDSTTHAYPCFKRFVEYGISCSLWQSGGDGYHIHSFFPELTTLNPDERKIMLDVLKKVILRGLLRPPELNSHICGGKPTLYQIEGAKHRKGGTKTLEATNLTGKENKIPADCWKQFFIEKRKAESERREYQKINPEIESPAFIKYFEEETFYKGGDGKKRAAFILASYYGMQIPDKKIIKEKLKQWNNQTLKNALEPHVIEGVTNSVINYYKNGGIRMPYNYAKNLLEELGRMDIWQQTLTQGGTQHDTREYGGTND